MNFFRKKGNGISVISKVGKGKCDKSCRKRYRHRYGKSLKEWEEYAQNEILMSDCPAGSICVISHNPHKKTREIGLNPGKTISVFKNEPADSNMIICLDMTRYIISKSIAARISVKAQTGDITEDGDQSEIK